MNPKSACDILNRFFFHGVGEGYFHAAQTHSISSYGAFRRLLPPVSIGMLTNGGVTAEEYVKILEDGAYSLVFADGAVAYIECTFDGNALYSYRFFYIPSPFHASHTLELPSDIPLADWLRMILEDQGVQCLKSVGALRFDCVRGLPANIDEPHPISHLTMMTGDCRIPIRGPVQVSTFLHFIFDNFQRSARPLWLEFSSYLAFDHSEVTITPSESTILHMNWETV